MKSNQDVFISGHAASVIRDKFLVMSTELQDEKSPSELAALWKTIPKANIVEHRSVEHCIFFSVSWRINRCVCVGFIL